MIANLVVPHLTWADVGLILALLALVLYARPVGRLLDRINFVRVGSTRLAARPQPDVPAPGPESATTIAQHGADDPFLEEGRTAIRGLLDQTVGPDPARREEALLTVSASFLAAWGFERVYSFIFGSQVEALYLLNSSAVVPLARFREVYDRAVTASPELYATFAFDRWQQYFIHHSLATFTTTEARITEAGRHFVVYVTQQGLPQKAL
jgi:hypothetical protein